MRRLAFLLALLFTLPAFSQAKHPFTFEDMMKLKRVGEPEPSPEPGSGGIVRNSCHRPCVAYAVLRHSSAGPAISR